MACSPRTAPTSRSSAACSTTSAMRPWPPVPDARETPLHRPVLLAETLERLRPTAGERVLDCTLGLGGHAEALLERGAAVVGVDRDPRARALAQARLERFGGRLTVRDGTFGETAEAMVAAGERFDGVLADLG